MSTRYLCRFSTGDYLTGMPKWWQVLSGPKWGPKWFAIEVDRNTAAKIKTMYTWGNVRLERVVR